MAPLRGMGGYSYSYEPAGNLLSKTMDGATTPMTYNAANELTQAGTKTLSYDPNGSRIGDSTGASYTYNAAGQMAMLTPSGGTALTMTYAGPGMSQRVAAGSKTYQYDQTGMKQFYNGTGTSQIVMTPTSTPVGYHTGGSTYYYLVDPDGSIAGIYSPDGLSLQNVVIYTPTGDVIDGSQYGPANAMGWHELDVSDGSTDRGGDCSYDPSTASDVSCGQTDTSGPSPHDHVFTLFGGGGHCYVDMHFHGRRYTGHVGRLYGDATAYCEGFADKITIDIIGQEWHAFPVIGYFGVGSWDDKGPASFGHCSFDDVRPYLAERCPRGDGWATYAGITGGKWRLKATACFWIEGHHGCAWDATRGIKF